MPLGEVKTPPYSEEAEKSVLGCMMLDRDAAETAVNMLSADDFYVDRNKWLFSSLTAIMQKGYAIDAVTLINELRDRGYYDKIGTAYIAELQDIVTSTRTIEQYCRIVREKSDLRLMIKNLSSYVNDCYEGKKPLKDIVEQAESFIYGISVNASRGQMLSVKDMILPALMKISELHESGEQFTGIATGFSDLDRITNGLQKADLILLAARPSVGKTALGLNIAENAAIRGGKTVAFFSLEMPAEQLIMRILASETEIDATVIKAGKQTGAQWKTLTRFNNDISESDIKLFIDDTSSISTSEVRTRLRKLKSSQGLDLVVIDYLQLMTASNTRATNREQEISSISKDLKSMAKDFNVPVIALSQLSRSPEKRTDTRPILSDLRESGAIEQDADIVLMLYRNPKPAEGEDPNMTELIISKHRNGETGTIKLSFLREFTKFVDYRGNN